MKNFLIIYNVVFLLAGNVLLATNHYFQYQKCASGRVHQPNLLCTVEEFLNLKQIEEDSERDRYFSAKDAKDYGLVDEVLNQDEKK